MPFFLFELLNLSKPFNLFTSEERKEPNNEVPPQQPLDSLVNRAKSPLLDEVDSKKQVTKKKTRKAISKKKHNNQGEVQTDVTIGRHVREPSTDDINFLIPL
jgi:hypothetical protein